MSGSKKTPILNARVDATLPMFLAIVFSVAAVAKIRDIEKFQASLIADSFATSSLVVYIAPVVIIAELGVVALLLTPS